MGIVERVKALKFPTGSYVVFGSGPLEAHGIRDAHDTDILVTEEYFRTLQKQGTWTYTQLPDHHEILQQGEITIYYSWAPDSWDVPQMIKDAEMIDGVPFVRLETVLDWKKIRNNAKDVRDIELIRTYLASRSHL